MAELLPALPPAPWPAEMAVQRVYPGEAAHVLTSASRRPPLTPVLTPMRHERAALDHVDATMEYSIQQRAELFHRGVPPRPEAQLPRPHTTDPSYEYYFARASRRLAEKHAADVQRALANATVAMIDARLREAVRAERYGGNRYERALSPPAARGTDNRHQPWEVYEYARMHRLLPAAGGSHPPTVLPGGDQEGRPATSSELASSMPRQRSHCFREEGRDGLESSQSARVPSAITGLSASYATGYGPFTAGDAAGAAGGARLPARKPPKTSPRLRLQKLERAHSPLTPRRRARVQAGATARPTSARVLAAPGAYPPSSRPSTHVACPRLVLPPRVGV